MISEDNEGKKFLHFKVPCTVKGVRGSCSFRQATFSFVTSTSCDHPISLPSLARCQLSSVDSRWNTSPTIKPFSFCKSLTWVHFLIFKSHGMCAYPCLILT